MGGSPVVYVTNPVFDDYRGINTYNEFAHWAPPAYTDASLISWHSVMKALAVAFAAINAAAMIEIANKRHKLAEDYLKMSELNWRRFRDSYAPLETSILAECWAPVVEPDYLAARSRAENFVRDGYSTSENSLARVAKKYSLCLDSSLLRSFNIDRATARDDSINFSYRNEEQYAIIKDDERWNRRSNMLNLGRGLISMASKYGALAGDIYSGAARAAEGGYSGAMSMIGYLSSRQGTVMPEYSQQYTMSTDVGSVMNHNTLLSMKDVTVPSLTGGTG